MIKISSQIGIVAPFLRCPLSDETYSTGGRMLLLGPGASLQHPRGREHALGPALPAARVRNLVGLIFFGGSAKGKWY